MIRKGNDWIGRIRSNSRNIVVEPEVTVCSLMNHRNCPAGTNRPLLMPWARFYRFVD